MINVKDVTQVLVNELGQVNLAVNEVVKERPRVTVGGLTDFLAEYLWETLLASGETAERAADRAGIDLQVFTACVRYVLEKRIAQVARDHSRHDDKYLEYPLCLYPLLETFGSVDDCETGLDVRPEQPEPPISPQPYESFIRLLRTHRIPVTKGLPLQVTVPNDLFYRLVIEEGIILAACDGQNVDPGTVLIRCFYDMPFISTFGAPRYSLGPVAAQRSAISLLVRLGLAKQDSL